MCPVDASYPRPDTPLNGQSATGDWGGTLSGSTIGTCHWNPRTHMGPRFYWEKRKRFYVGDTRRGAVVWCHHRWENKDIQRGEGKGHPAPQYLC